MHQSLEKTIRSYRTAIWAFPMVALALWMGCATKHLDSKSATSGSSKDIMMVLDNLAFLNEGYQIVLWRNGSFTGVHYTDYSEPELSRRGQHTLKADQLRLTNAHGGSEILHRVSFEQFDYWIHSEDRPQLTNNFFRFRALKTISIEQAQRFPWWKLHNDSNEMSAK